MSLNAGTSAPLHIGANELPSIDFGGGNRLKVIQVNRHAGLWITENTFMAGFEVQTHRHTGPSWTYTISGAWRYKEYDYVAQAGSTVYEPAGSLHTLQVIEDNTRVWTLLYGSTLNLDHNGDVEFVIDGPGSLEFYNALCEAQGLPRPGVLMD